MKMTFLLSLCILSALIVPCAAQIVSGSSAVVPADIWPFAAADTLQKAGIVFGNPNQVSTGRRVVTRYDFAVAIAPLLVQTVPRSPRTKATLDNLHSNRHLDFENRLLASPPAIAALKSLVYEFTPELLLYSRTSPLTVIV